MSFEPIHNGDLLAPAGAAALWTGRAIRLGKFALVGGSGVFVNMIVFQLAYWAFEGARAPSWLHHAAANLCGIAVSIFTNFLLNDTWTWSDRRKGARRDWWARVTRYYAACSIAALCQLSVSSVLFNYLFADLEPLKISHVDLMPQIPLLIGIVCGIAINFPLSHFWAFKHSDSNEEPPR